MKDLEVNFRTQNQSPNLVNCKRKKRQIDKEEGR